MMIPLIAFVTLMSGVCSAGVTLQTTCQPTKQARTNTVRCVRKVCRRAPADAEERQADAKQQPPRGGGWLSDRDRACELTEMTDGELGRMTRWRNCRRRGLYCRS